MKPACWISFVLALAAPARALPQSGASQKDAPSAERRAEDKALRKRWKALAPEHKLEFVEFFRYELRGLNSYQIKLERFVLREQDVDPSTWPAADPESHAPYYEPEVHAPPAAKRRWLKADDPKVEKLRKRFFRRHPQPALDSMWSYDYATRGIVRRGELDDAQSLERTFENALAGFSPYAGLVQALVERKLDDGAQQARLTAFGHNYTDRDGRAYPGLTLYDAWASGAKMEMPDVDCLGLLHDLEDDWKSFEAPVPGSKHRELYERIGGLFEDAHHHRALRHALARTFVGGSVQLRDGYQFQLDKLHALWEQHDSRADRLLDSLPDAADWMTFFERIGREYDGDPQLQKKAAERKATLDAGHAELRAALIRALDPFEVDLAARLALEEEKAKAEEAAAGKKGKQRKKTD